MTLQTFFRLPYKKEFFQPGLDSAYSSFERRYIYKDRFLYAKVRIINYKEQHTHVFLSYQFERGELEQKKYLCKHEFIGNKILLTNFGQ